MMRDKIVLLLVIAVTGLLFIGLYSDVPSYGSFPERPLDSEIEGTAFNSEPGKILNSEVLGGSGSLQSIGQPILERTPQSPPDGLGIPNVVTGVLWGFRAYDTMGEATVLFTAVVSVVLLAGHTGLVAPCKSTGMSVIVKTGGRVLAPILMLFGAYIIMYGHLTPGGGFPGGVIIAAAMTILLLGFGLRFACSNVGFLPCELGEELGALLIIFVGIAGLLTGTYFFQTWAYVGELGDLFSSLNILLLNIAVGLKVFGGVLLIVYSLLSSFGGVTE